MNRLFLLLISILPIVLLGQSRQPLPPTESNHRPSFLKPWQIPDVSGEVLCRQYEVFENREAKAGRKIALNIQILASPDSNPATDPLFFLAGILVSKGVRKIMNVIVNVCGIDLSAEMVRQAQRLSPDISFKQWDMFALTGIADNSFGGIALLGNRQLTAVLSP